MYRNPHIFGKKISFKVGFRFVITSQGEPGDRGAMGEAGERGEIGDSGPVGPPGDPGAKGFPVSDGVNLNLVDKISTNSSLDNASLSEICPDDVMFLYQGPEGKQGPPGNRGRPGKKVTSIINDCQKMH